MTITKIEKDTNSASIYNVTFKPNWFEKLLGKTEHTVQYRQSWSTYTYGSGAVYFDKDGRELGNGNWIGEAIDRFRRKW